MFEIIIVAIMKLCLFNFIGSKTNLCKYTFLWEKKKQHKNSKCL